MSRYRSGEMTVVVQGQRITCDVHEELGDRLTIDMWDLPDGVTTDDVAEAVVERVQEIREDERCEAAEWQGAL